MRVVLVRHPTPLIAAGVCYGRLDVAAETSEIERMVYDRAMVGARVVWTSPAVRCLHVAEAIAAALGVKSRTDRRLLELDFGHWEGRAWSTISGDDLDRWAADPLGFAPPGGESGAALVARMRDFCALLREDCVVVSHGGPLKVLEALLCDRPVDLLAAAPPIGSVTVVCRGLCSPAGLAPSPSQDNNLLKGWKKGHAS
jgi:alpha-ribazole phosphatase